jgi:hypothetical protein
LPQTDGGGEIRRVEAENNPHRIDPGHLSGPRQSTLRLFFPDSVNAPRIPFVISGIRKNGRAIRKKVLHRCADRWDANFSVVLVDLGGFALTLFLCFVMFEHHSSPHMLLG